MFCLQGNGMIIARIYQMITSFCRSACNSLALERWMLETATCHEIVFWHNGDSTGSPNVEETRGASFTLSGSQRCEVRTNQSQYVLFFTDANSTVCTVDECKWWLVARGEASAIASTYTRLGWLRPLRTNQKIEFPNSCENRFLDRKNVCKS